MLSKLKVSFLKRFFKTALLWWRYWSYLFRWLHHSKYKNVRLETGLDYKTVLRRLMILQWTKDGTKELWDACGSPHWVQFAIDEMRLRSGRQPKGGLDCDDFTSWALAALHPKYDARILQVAWLDQDGLPRGHVMCMCRTKEGKVFHIGNWGKSDVRDFPEELVEDVLLRAKASELIGWSIMRPDLSIIRCDTYLPLSSPR